MSASVLDGWKIVQSRSDKHPDCGYPLGLILCRSLEDAERFVENSEFNDCYIRNFSEVENRFDAPATLG